MPELHETRTGRKFFEVDVPQIAKALTQIATALDREPAVPWKMATSTIYTKENILKYASEDELFAVFHTFEQYMREQVLDRCGSEGPVILDSDFGKVIKKLKANYKVIQK
jgi:hypothetical protein